MMRALRSSVVNKIVLAANAVVLGTRLKAGESELATGGGESF